MLLSLLELPSVTELNMATAAVGLKMNIAKTKLLVNSEISDQPPNIVDNEATIECADSYNYVSQLLGAKTKREAEIGWRISVAWRAFVMYKHIVASMHVSAVLKTRLHDMVVLATRCRGMSTKWQSRSGV